MSDNPAASPLIEIRGLTRSFSAGETAITVLHGIDLTIRRGEMVAIIGASGSGKSTLMNILGCLDRPSGGEYLYSGQNVGTMDEEARARLRREHFGFIFQRYQLLADLDALGNVEIPAIYAGQPVAARRPRARALLERLGLGGRLGHRPSELSGGQQQRVSVARALMNGGELILADEPTGALDSHSGQELLALLETLNQQGHTIIIVTHDREVAARAGRIIEMRDGRIISDQRNAPRQDAGDPALSVVSERPGLTAGRLKEALLMALRGLSAHRMRSFLTMLGIIIGIASVVSVIALGTGSRERVLAEISALGTNTVTVRPGSGFGDRRAEAIRSLVSADADAIAREDFSISVSPEISSSGLATRGRISMQASVTGVGVEYFDAEGLRIDRGRLFDQHHVDSAAQVVLLNAEAVKTFFPEGDDPLGQTIRLDRMPATIIGQIDDDGGFGGGSPRFFVPYTTVTKRINGQTHVHEILVRFQDHLTLPEVEEMITALLVRRHGKKDFFMTNSAAIRESIDNTTRTLSMLIASIALISLVVGGIGVMNIMLASVTERTREIGVRVAVGARRADIIAQFLTEAVVVCLLGGIIGVALAIGGGLVLTHFQEQIRLSYSPASILLAFLSSTVIGLTFGYLPARAASRMDPVAALARE